MFRIGFDTYHEADIVYKQLMDLSRRYAKLTIQDIIDIVGEEKIPVTYNYGYKSKDYGWFIPNVEIHSRALTLWDRVMYFVELPEPTLESDETKPDMVNHPPHYQSKSGLEVIDVIEAFTEGLVGAEATNTGNIIKYICRWKKKNGLEDLKKCRYYINRLIDFVEKENE